MKGLGETSRFHRFNNHRRDESAYVCSWVHIFTIYFPLMQLVFYCIVKKKEEMQSLHFIQIIVSSYHHTVSLQVAMEILIHFKRIGGLYSYYVLYIHCILIV